ncbi:MAG TPA: TonB-dependent receptor [Bryobacteraceae bacterium]|nr:TonB-dependent receptor [Bryobacteraceae bacterium]
MKFRFLAVLCALVSLCAPVPSFSQSVTAKAVGIVTDPSGAIIQGAKVTIRNQQTNQVRTGTTDNLGSYEFTFLPIGSYTLSVEAVGFQRAEVSSFQLNVDQVARVDVKLSVGQAAETVEVQAGAVLLQTEDATVGTVIDSKKVVELPLNGRSFVQLALLTPGVNPGTPGSITVRRLRGSVGQAVGMSANGARDTQNRFYYDGIEAMDLDSYSFSFSPSIDAINEFKVQSSTYSAEVGGSPGGQVNLTTKSGSNLFHGTLWEFNRNDAFTALNGFQPRTPGAKPPRLNRNQFGANLGGPVLLPKLYNGKDKTFFFFNWESGRQVSGSFGGQAYVPPAALRTGNFAGAATIYDPLTKQPFPNNVIPTTRIASYASKFLSDWVPQPNTNEAGINFRGVPASAPITQDQYVSRIDHVFSPRDTMNGSYMYNIQADDTTPIFGFDTRGNRARAQNLSLAEVHVFSPTIINEVRVGWDRFFEHEFFGTTGNSKYDIANQLGIPGVSTDPRNYGPPTFSAGYDMPVVRSIGPRDRLNQLWQVSDNVSIRRGSHFFKTGLMIARRNWTFDEAVNARGSFTFDGTVTAGGVNASRENQFADFLLGLATGAQISAQPFATRMNNFWHAYYFQDDWKVLPSLTINMGLRWEFYGRPVQRGKATNFDMNGFLPSLQTYHGFPDIPDTPNHPAALANDDYNDFGPRFGFAWSVPHVRDFVVRGGYGIYYTPEITNSWTTLTLNPPIVQTYTFTGNAANPINVATAFTGQGVGQNTFGSGGVDPDLRDSYTQQWNLTVQKKLPADFYLDIGYVGSKGTRLTTSYDGNRPLDIVTPGPAVPSIASRRPLQGFAGISVAKSIANSTYHSLQVKAERRVGHGFSILGAYTWSKSLSNSDISTVGGGSFLGGIQDYMNLSGEKSYSAFDVPHRLSVSALYDVPLFNHSPGVIRALLGGWQLGTIITEQTGFAAALSGVVDTTGTGIASRPNVVAGQSAMLPRDQRTRDRWFNTAAFALPVAGQFGNSTREQIHLPGLNQVDFSATKNFRFWESHQVQFRAEFFNFFNHVNLGAPGLNIRDPQNFGRVTSTVQGAAGMPGDARVVQFGLKYSF